MVLLGVWLCLQPSVGEAAAQQLEIEVPRGTQTIRSRTHEGRAYYRLSQIAQLLELTLVERGGLLEARGSRGVVQMTAGRPLVRYQQQYLLLSDPVWRRSSGEWYVPEDFLAKVAPLLLEAKFERIAERRYQLQSLVENRVQLQVVNYPDHVAIIFIPSRRAPIRVQELTGAIRVSFGDFRVVPSLPRTPLDPELVQRIRFDSEDLFGSFDIIKGGSYHSYREYDLSDPWRKVVGIYRAPITTSAPGAATVLQPTPRSVTELAFPPLGGDEIAKEFEPPPSGTAVTIDPGHGGENYGVRPSQELLEKNFTQKLAEEIVRQMKGNRIQLYTTRTRDINLSAQQRSSLANFNRSKAFVSLHFGGSHEESLRGPVVYVQEPIDEPLGSPRLVPWALGQQRYMTRSRRLAEILQQKLNALLGTDNSIVEAPLAVLAPVTAPAVLVEAGFLTNPRDQEILRSPDGMAEIGRAVVDSLQEFLR